MKYTEFVKANYDKVANLPAKQRMAKLGQMWKASGHSSAKGKGVVGGSEGGMFIKRRGRKGKKQAKGKGLLSGVLGSFGLGMEPHGGVVEQHNVAGPAKGSGIFSDVLGSFGLGMEPQGGATVGGAVKRGRKMKKVEGKGIISDTLGAFGLGMKKRGRKAKGGATVGGDVAGGGIFSGLLGSIGLGMPDKVKLKHFNRMKVLEKQLHEKGKLTPVQHHKLKVYHTLHGAGFFDSLLNIGKKVVGAVPKAVASIPTILKVVPEAGKYIPSVLSKVAPIAAMI